MENTIALKNIEALAYEETINPEILRICTEARGFCAHNRIQYIGIHMKAD